MTTPRMVLMANIDKVGGAQRVVHVVAQALAERGYPVDLVGVAPFAPRHGFADPAFRAHPHARAVRATGFGADDSPAPVRPPPDRPAIRPGPRPGRRWATCSPTGRRASSVTSQVWAMKSTSPRSRTWAVIAQYHSSFEAAAWRGRCRCTRTSTTRVTLLTPEDVESFRRAGLNGTAWLPNPLSPSAGGAG